MNGKTDKTRQYVNVFKKYDFTDFSTIFFNQYAENIIDVASDWYVSIDRFRIPTTDVPIMIFDATPNHYIVELSYNGVYSGGHSVIYVPTNTLDPSHSQYYYIYQYDHMIDMINTALSNAFTTLATLVGGSFPADAVPPHFQIDHSTKILSFEAQQAYYDESLTVNKIETYSNRNLYHYTSGTYIFYDRSSPLTRSVRYIAKNLGNNLYNRVTPASNPDYYMMESNIGPYSLIRWNDAVGLVLISSSLSSNSEYLPLGDYNKLINSRKILANFDFIYTQTETTPCNAQYILQSPYKKIDLLSNTPINSIDITIYWVDRQNVMRPLTLNLNESYSIRLVFIKKKKSKK